MHYAMIDSDLEDAVIDSNSGSQSQEDISEDLIEDKIQDDRETSVSVFDVPLLTDVVAEAMRASLDRFTECDSYDNMILAHTTAQHE